MNTIKFYILRDTVTGKYVGNFFNYRDHLVEFADAKKLASFKSAKGYRTSQVKEFGYRLDDYKRFKTFDSFSAEAEFRLTDPNKYAFLEILEIEISENMAKKVA